MGSSVSVASPTPGLVLGAGAALPAICTLAVAARLVNHRGVDGWLSIPALILLWGQGICLIIGVKRKALAAPDPVPPPGVDPETWISPQNILDSDLFYAILLIQIPCLTLIKLSFVFFYRRLFISRVQRSFLRWYLHGLALLLVAWAIAFFFSELFTCGTKFSYIFYATNEQQAEYCIPFTPWDDSLAATDFIFDILIFITPIPLVSRLKLSHGQKWGTLAVFSLGGLAMAASVTRFVIFVDEDANSFTLCLYWTAIESGVALLACGLPSTFGIYANAWRQIKEKRSGYKSSSKASDPFGSDSRTLVSTGGRGRLNSTSSELAKKDTHRVIHVENTYNVDAHTIDLENFAVTRP